MMLSGCINNRTVTSAKHSPNLFGECFADMLLLFQFFIDFSAVEQGEQIECEEDDEHDDKYCAGIEENIHRLNCYPSVKQRNCCECCDTCPELDYCGECL